MWLTITVLPWLRFVGFLSPRRQPGNIVTTDLSRADLRNANLRGIDLRSRRFYGADLSGADLSGADLRDANMYGADLRHAYLHGADLRGANLGGANLGNAFLGGADLRGAALRGANLAWSYLGRADLSDADLIGANLAHCGGQKARLDRADLTDADLIHADLANASLVGVSLAGARFRRTNLIRTLFRGATGLPEITDQCDRLTAVATAALSPGALRMEMWHTVRDAHCIAGWAINLAGREGQFLAQAYGLYLAGHILLGSEAAEHFWDDNAQAASYLKGVLASST
jgi:uncharacterized protein YjbI with pentapeptide repeats